MVIVPRPGLKDPLPLPHRSGWFPEAYVKALEEGPVNPMTPVTPMTSMSPMTPMMPVKPGNELPSRYLSHQGWVGVRTPARVPLPSGEDLLGTVLF